MSDAKIPNSGGTLADVIRDHMEYRDWKSVTLRQHFSGCESAGELVDKCGHEEPNVRLVAAWLLGQCDLSAWERDAAIEALQPLLKDERCNEIAYAGLDADDEESPTPRVADFAAEALDRIKPDWRPRPPK